jgi:hypothetical protein
MKIKTKTCQTHSSNRCSLNTPPRACSLVAIAFALAGLIGLLGIANTAQADNTLYRTGFEQSTFHVGDLLDGNDGWIALTSPPFSPNAATITSATAKSGRQSIVVPGGLLDSQSGIEPYDAVGIYRRPLNGGLGYDTSVGNKKLARVDADLMLATPKRTPTPGQFFSLTISGRAGDGGLGEIGLSSKGVVEAWTFDAPPGGEPLRECTKRINLKRWHHITILHNFTSDRTLYFIDEHFLCDTPAPRNDVLLRGAMGVFARLDGGAEGGIGSLRSDYTARFDNFRISVHSETPDID